MIAFLRGRLAQRQENQIILDVNGVGYEVLLPAFVATTLEGQEPGAEIELFTYYHVSEKQPRPQLIGFNREFERSFFEEFISVSGIGPGRAARALRYSVSTVANAIETADKQLLSRLDGIGPRTAEKIIATLRGKVGAYALLRDESVESRETPQPITSERDHEALAILVQLGYKRPEALQMIRKALDHDPSVTSGIDLIQLIYQLGIGR